ncbi:MAG: hypothetical protein H6810_10605 [Phycisphaeraceae bacterium]|nr:MAG: hypothetical protein H6810_10605 [Phycisphaeraceae bacterium]
MRRFALILIGLLPSLLAVRGTLAEPPELLTEMAETLHATTWAAEVEVFTAEGAVEGSISRAKLWVWHEPGGVVRLAIGHIHIVASPGRLIAVHTNNPKLIFETVEEGASAASLLAGNLPPLWCPWLAVALDGDPSAWPRVGSAGARRVDWALGGSGIIDGPTGGGVKHSFHGRPADSDDELTWTITVMHADAADEEADGRLSQSYTLKTTVNGRERRFNFVFRPLDAAWKPIDSEGRQLVSSISVLAPATPEIGPDDHLPPIVASVVANDDLAVDTWRPGQVFERRETERRPQAVVLALIRAGGETEDTLRTVATLVRKAEGAAKRGGTVSVLARPIVCTGTRDLDLGRFKRFGLMWAGAVDADPTIPEAEARTPGLAWCPASLLLDRVAPGADAAIVVVDRSGWIVGVHPPDATPEEIAESIKTAAR